MTEEQLRDKIGKCLNIFPDEFEEYLPNNVGTSHINDLMSLFTRQLELAKIAERLDIRGRINYIHDKYPGDSTEDDRLFRNEFMKMFSEYMGETTKMVKSLSELNSQK